MRSSNNLNFDEDNYGQSAEAAASTLLLGPGSLPFDEAHAESYVPCDADAAMELSIRTGRKFVDNILKRGAIVYRSAELHRIRSTMLASEVAKEMSLREGVVLKKIENLVKSLRRELPQARKLARRLESVGKRLSIGKSLENALREITTD